MLLKAANPGHESVVQLLLEGTDISANNDNGETALSRAAQHRGHEANFLAAVWGQRRNS